MEDEETPILADTASVEETEPAPPPDEIPVEAAVEASSEAVREEVTVEEGEDEETTAGEETEIEGDEEFKGFGEERLADEERLSEESNAELMKGLEVKQESLDALVKSSSVQLAKEQSLVVEPEEDSSSAMLLDEKRDRHAARAKEVLGEVIDIRRGSLAGEAVDKRTIRFMNTYKLESDTPFNSEKVDKILQTVMIEAMQDLKYEPEKCCKQAKWASNTIKAKVKQMEFDRYKIISLVSIGQKHNQDVLCTCRFLWDSDRDNYSRYTLENAYIFGIALCFGFYYE